MLALVILPLLGIVVVAEVIGQHSWADVAYVVALIVLAVVNAFAHKAIKAKADKVEREVVDVKRAVGVTKRDEDPDPVTPFESARCTTAPPGHRRWVDGDE